jgi:methyl-accepting chemotaxis protein
MTQNNGNHSNPDRLDILVDQVGRLTEVVTVGFSEMREGISEMREGISEMREGISEMREGISEMRQGISDLRESVTAGFQELKSISERQEQNISRLADTVARQAEIVEMLIRDRQATA